MSTHYLNLMQNILFGDRIYRVLIVDDSKYNILALKLILQQISNFQLLEAQNGEEAIKVIEQQVAKKNATIDFLFIDLNMPIMDGITATHVIK